MNQLKFSRNKMKVRRGWRDGSRRRLLGVFCAESFQIRLDPRPAQRALRQFRQTPVPDAEVAARQKHHVARLRHAHDALSLCVARAIQIAHQVARKRYIIRCIIMMIMMI